MALVTQVMCLKIKSLCLVFSMSSFGVWAQMTTSNTLTPLQLVQDVLLGGGVTVSNVQFTGYINALGKFDISGVNNMGMQEGIVLTTGSIFHNDPVFGFGGTFSDGPQGPNNSTGGGIDNMEPGDPYLESLLSGGVPTYNRAILEFDFVPTSDSIRFDYVFGTDEYMEFISGGFADIFAFVLSGVSVPMPATNIALIPNTTTPVTALTINANTNSQYYVDNENPPGQICQYDGFTKVLTARAQVICGETYHIRIMIADALDGAVDAGVFLKAGSFSSSGGVQIAAHTGLGPNDTTFVEGCQNVYVTFKRTGAVSSTLTLPLSVSGTATSGLDYTALPPSITFPAGVDSVALPITILSDGLLEGIESLIVSISTNTTCGVITTSAIFYIQDPTPMSLDVGNDLVLECADVSFPVQITAQVAGGHGVYSYQWSNGLTGNPAIFLPFPGIISLIVQDQCANQISDSLTITFINAVPLLLTAANDTLICQGQSLNLWSQATGGNGNIQYNWSTGAQTSSIVVQPPHTTTYTVTVSDQCGMVATEDIKVIVSALDASFMFHATGTPLEYTFDNLSIGNIVHWIWDFGDGNVSSQWEPTHLYEHPGWYHVTLNILNEHGCTDIFEVDLHARVETVIFIPNSFTPNLDGHNEFFIPYGNNIETMEMWIFDRWGRNLFYTTDKESGWNGGDFTTGTYVYRIEIVDDEGHEYSFRGALHLIK